jgi:hypothetical protein
MESLDLPPRWTARSLASVLVFATLSCGSPSAPATGQQNTNTTAVYLSITAKSASQGDTVGLGISFTSGDTPGDPLLLEISFDGSTPGVDTLTIPAAATGDPTQTPLSLSGYIVLPNGLPDGRLTITAILPVQGDTSSATVAVKDARPPYFIGDGAVVVPGLTPYAFVNNFASSSTVIDFVAGATDSVVTTTGDNHGVAWVGWAFGPPSNARDSVAVAGTAVRASMPLTVPASLAGTTPTFSVFARDSDGNMVVDSFGQVNVAAYVHHPVRTVAVDTATTDIAYDAKRNVLYLSEAGHANVLVLSLASMAFQTPLALPAPPAGLDLTPGGDTLVVALANSGDLALVRLTGTPTTTVVQLASLDSVPGDSTTITSAARSVRVAADGRVIVGTYQAKNGIQRGAVVELNLATGRDSLASPASIVAMARSADATRVFLSGTFLSDNVGATVYDGVAHQFAGLSEPLEGPQDGRLMSASQNGAYFLDGNALYGGNLAGMGFLRDDNVLSSQGYGAAISDNGTTVWLGGAGVCTTGAGPGPCAVNQPGFYFRFQVPIAVRNQEGQLLEVADAPQGIVQLVALPGDHTLIGVGANEIMAFDLTTSTPGPVASRVASHALLPRATRLRAAVREPRLDFRVRLRDKTRILRITPLAR